jgi:hypothetical protein
MLNAEHAHTQELKNLMANKPSPSQHKTHPRPESKDPELDLPRSQPLSLTISPSGSSDHFNRIVQGL